MFGAPVVGLLVVGAAVVGAPVVGAAVVGAPVDGDPEVGAPVVGTPVVGAPVFGITVVGTSEGELDGTVVINNASLGDNVGCAEGLNAGSTVVGVIERVFVGLADGIAEGLKVGASDGGKVDTGALVGEIVGSSEGATEGFSEGFEDTVVEGVTDSDIVGTAVEKPPGTLQRLYVEVTSGTRHCLYVLPGCEPQNAPGLQQGD